MYYLGLDIGTSAVKAIVIDELSVLLAETSIPLSSSHPRPDWSEQNPDDWVSAVESACAELRQHLGEQWKKISAIGLSGQMHGATLLDKHHRPLRPAILWNDGRSVSQCDAINAKVADIEERAGIFAMPGFTAPKVLWCAENEPQLYSKISHILLPKDYVRLALTGTLATDMADAAGTLWLNQADRKWDSILCSASQTNVSWLPRLVEGNEISGELRPEMASRLGLTAGIPVAGGGGDAAAGAIGIGSIHEGDAFVSLGTSGQLFVSKETYSAAPGTVLHCFAHCVPDRWFQMGCLLNGASPMSWFANFTNSRIGDLLKEAETVSTAPFFLPYLTGERTPHNDAKIRGAFYGLGPETTNAHAMRAVVEAIAYSFCDANACLQKAGTNLQSIASIGGGTKSDFVLQTMADAMNVTIQRYSGAEIGPAFGAARLAILAATNNSLNEVVSKPKLECQFEPQTEKADYHRDKLNKWRQFYTALKPVAAI